MKTAISELKIKCVLGWCIMLFYLGADKRRKVKVEIIILVPLRNFLPSYKRKEKYCLTQSLVWI